MVYVVRFSNNIEQDIERGWSGYFAPFETDLETALREVVWADREIDEYDEGLAAQWILDMDRDEYLEYLAGKNDLRQDPHSGAWRPFHHDGLSCWVLEADDLESAFAEAQTRTDIDWAGFGQATVGNVRVIGCVLFHQEQHNKLWLLECDDYTSEG